MQLNQYVFTFGDYLKSRFGQSVHKISLDGGFSCPNRDGTLGRGGCTFCNVHSFAGAQKSKSISEQLAANRSGKSLKYLAYFQAYTSTYAERQVLMSYYDEALKSADIVGLCVGTRPDCVSNEVLDLLASYQDAGKEIWLELGLQTAFDESLMAINRHHTFADYCDAVSRAHARGLKVCTHLILGLPGEEHLHNLTTLELVLNEGVEALKLHQLHIVRGSIMAKQYERGEISVLELPEYAARAADLIRNTPPQVIFARVGASVMDDSLIAPLWSSKRWPCINEIVAILDRDGPQGSARGQSFVPQDYYHL